MRYARMIYEVLFDNLLLREMLTSPIPENCSMSKRNQNMLQIYPEARFSDNPPNHLYCEVKVLALPNRLLMPAGGPTDVIYPTSTLKPSYAAKVIPKFYDIC